jgi:hypothetical protein
MPNNQDNAATLPWYGPPQPVSDTTLRRWAEMYARYYNNVQWGVHYNAQITWEMNARSCPPSQEAPAPTDPNDGSEIGTVPHTNLHGGRLVWLYMGGQWLKGGWNRSVLPQCFCSLPDGQHSFDWDKANQPTRWKSLR